MLIKNLQETDTKLLARERAHAFSGLEKYPAEYLFTVLQTRKLLEILENPELNTLIYTGKVTLSIIRPRADFNTLHANDLEMEKIITSRIEDPLQIISSFSIIFDEKSIEDFYGSELKKILLDIPPRQFTNFDNRWLEFVHLMTFGPSTVLILYSDQNQAIDHWREQIGHWDIESTKQPDTLRGEFCLDSYNDLMHGSDSIESVKHELSVVIDQLRKMWSTTHN